MTRIYLIRHAEAEGNLYRIAHGHYNSVITDYRGPKQIRALSQRFADEVIDAVYSSDLIRTQTTAQALWVPRGLPLHTAAAFREVHMGPWEGCTWHEVSLRWPEELNQFSHRLDLWHMEGCETARQVLDRFLPALEQVARSHDGQTAAVFSHGAALRIVLGTLQGLSLREIGQSPHGDNTAVSLLEYEDGRFRVVYRDDSSHLAREDLSTFSKQSWLKSKRSFEDGADYLPMPKRLREALGVSRPGEATLIRYNGDDIGALQTHEENGRGRIDRYYLAPLWRGQGLGIPPMGQIIQQYRSRGLTHLCLTCADPALRAFFARLGFYAVGEKEMEKDIRQRVRPIITG